MAGTVEIYADDVLKRIDWLMTTDKQARKQFTAIIRESIKEAKKEVTASAKGAMKSDPRQAYKAVRTTVYKKILGANVNILDSRKAAKSMRLWRPQTTMQEGQWGGNRRKRSDRTKQVDGYYGADRAFILRFVNEGTQPRGVRCSTEAERNGNRGQISARHFFSPGAERGMAKAMQKMDGLIQRAIVEIWNK